MQMVMLGTLSLSGAAGVAAMRRKLLAVAQQLGLGTIRSTRLAGAASDHAKTIIKNGSLELRVALNGEKSTQELCVEFVSVEPNPTQVLEPGFDRIESLADGKGWRGCCSLHHSAAVADADIARSQAIISEQGVGELVEALHANNQALQVAKEAEESARAQLTSLLGAAPAVIYSFAASGDFSPIFVSDNIETLLGYQPDEYLENADCTEGRVHPDDIVCRRLLEKKQARSCSSWRR